MSATPLTSPRATSLLTLSTLAAALFLPVAALAQSTTAPDSGALMPPTSAPASSHVTTAPAAPSAVSFTGPMTTTTPITQPFVGTIAADRVYVRSGPGPAYYEIGQLSKGDLVQVVGSRQGWFQILPPNGTFCMVAKELVDVDSSNTSGAAKADYLNVRAGTALNKTRDPSVVLCVIRKGTKLTILGSTDKYYEIAPPEKAYVFISPQFVKNNGVVAEYKVPDLKLPAGVTGPAKNTVSAPTGLPSPTVDIPNTPPDGNIVTPGTMDQPPSTTLPATADTRNLKHTADHTPIPQPTTTFSTDAYAHFNELNARYQTELQKPVGHRDLDPLIKDYKALAATTNLPPSVAQGTETRIAALEKLAAIQRLQHENAASAETMTQQQRALQEQYAAAERAIKDYEQTGPYLAQGRLQTSTAVEGKYALVNPATGRVIAYVDPQADVDIASLLGKYIGVRGSSSTPDGTNMTVIQVKNATLLPEPQTTPR